MPSINDTVAARLCELADDYPTLRSLLLETARRVDGDLGPLRIAVRNPQAQTFELVRGGTPVPGEIYASLPAAADRQKDLASP